MTISYKPTNEYFSLFLSLYNDGKLFCNEDLLILILILNISFLFMLLNADNFHFSLCHLSCLQPSLKNEKNYNDRAGVGSTSE